MCKKLMNTTDDIALLAVRLALGVVMLPHGLQKTLGWYGGHGYAGTLEHFTTHMGIPWLLALLVILAESLGAVGLIVGFFTRLAALGIFSVMVGAIVMVHAKNGFFMNWFGAQGGEGFEYHLLAIGCAIALIIRGGGALSLDGKISSNRSGGV